MEDYKVKTEIFEGPLDLLLNLIEKRIRNKLIEYNKKQSFKK